MGGEAGLDVGDSLLVDGAAGVSDACPGWGFGCAIGSLASSAPNADWRSDDNRWYSGGNDALLALGTSVVAAGAADAAIVAPRGGPAGSGSVEFSGASASSSNDLSAGARRAVVVDLSATPETGGGMSAVTPDGSAACVPVAVC
jgi:hypothetical protein